MWCDCVIAWSRFEGHGVTWSDSWELEGFVHG
jgi:hypothetical protein